MKYLYEATKRAKVVWMIVAQLIISTVDLWINANILKWIDLAIKDANHMHYVNLIIVGCIVNTILEGLIRMCFLGRHYIFAHLNNVIADKVFNGGVAMYLEMSTGKIVSIVGNLKEITSVISSLIELVRNVATVVINVIFILRITTSQMSWMGLFFMIVAVSMYFINKWWNKIDTYVEEIKKERNELLHDSIDGFMECNSYLRAAKANNVRIHELNKMMGTALLQRTICSSLMDLIMGFSSTGIIIILVLYAIAAIGTGELEASVAITLIIYWWRLEGPFCNIVLGLGDIAEAKSKLPALIDFTSYQNKVKDGNLVLKSFDSKIEIGKVSFEYADSSNILQDLNMVIKKGQRVGICGETGAGKSTLLKLLLRFYDVFKGAIKIDGVNIKKFTLESYRKLVGAVHQDTFIFNGSIRDNIAFAMKPTVVTDDEIIKACKDAGLWKFIETLPNRLDTEVGNHGLKLSGGQKQRISLARVFLANPEIIVLDEATSALDNATEKSIINALAKKTGKTIISVAHRLTTIKDCDVIFVLGKRGIIERGTHEELLAKHGTYAEMWKAGLEE